MIPISLFIQFFYFDVFPYLNTQDNSQAAVNILNQANNLWFLFSTVQKVMSSTRQGKYPVQSPDKHQIILNKVLTFSIAKVTSEFFGLVYYLIYILTIMSLIKFQMLRKESPRNRPRAPKHIYILNILKGFFEHISTSNFCYKRLQSMNSYFCFSHSIRGGEVE